MESKRGVEEFDSRRKRSFLPIFLAFLGGLFLGLIIVGKYHPNNYRLKIEGSGIVFLAPRAGDTISWEDATDPKKTPEITILSQGMCESGTNPCKVTAATGQRYYVCSNPTCQDPGADPNSSSDPNQTFMDLNGSILKLFGSGFKQPVNQTYKLPIVTTKAGQQQVTPAAQQAAAAVSPSVAYPATVCGDGQGSDPLAGDLAIQQLVNGSILMNQPIDIAKGGTINWVNGSVDFVIQNLDSSVCSRYSFDSTTPGGAFCVLNPAISGTASETTILYAVSLPGAKPDKTCKGTKTVQSSLHITQ